MQRYEFPLGEAGLGEAGRIVVAFTERQDGDFAVNDALATAELQQHRIQIAPVPWVWCRQVHGSKVAVAGQMASGSIADALIAAEPNVALSITVADCAPIAVWSNKGALAAIHAGWRGLQGGVIAEAVKQLRDLDSQSTGGSSSLVALVGPHICAGCYDFSPADAVELQRKWGSDILTRSQSDQGQPELKLDLGLITQKALKHAGVTQIHTHGSCTSCNPESWFSHRARGELARNAMVVWREN